MDTPIPNSNLISTNVKTIKAMTERYVNEIKHQQTLPQKDFKTEANNLFGFNGSNLKTDIFTDIFHKYQKEMGLASNIIEVFDNWLLNKLPMQIMSTTKKTESGVERYFDNVRFAPPFMSDKSIKKSKQSSLNYIDSNQELLDLLPDESVVPMYPRDAINLQATYAVTVYVDVYYEPEGLETEEDKRTFRVKLFDKMMIGEIPILKGSHFCWLRGLTDAQKAAVDECFNDPLGYWVIKGAEKSSLSKQKLAASQMLVFKQDKKSPLHIRMACLTVKASLMTEIFVDPKMNNIFMTTLFKAEPIPTFIIFLVLELLSGTEIPVNVSLSQYASDFYMNDIVPLIKDFVDEEDQDIVYYQLISSISDARSRIEELTASKPDLEPLELLLSYIRSHQKEKIAVSRKANANTESVDIVEKIRNNIFGSIVVDDITSNVDFPIRKTMLAKMVSIIGRTLAGVRPETDRDSCFNTRIHTAGRNLESLFNGYWKQELDEWKIFAGNPTIPGAKITTRRITDGFARELVSGVPGAGNKKDQITDSMKRETPMAVYSQLQRVTIAADASARLDAPRQLHPSQLGYICSGETPEGAGCGRIKHLSTTCWISIPRDFSDVIPKFEEYLTEDREDLAQVPVLFNGIIQGWTYPGSYEDIWTNIKTSIDTFDVCCTYNRIDNHIDIFSDGSRPTRPLLVVDRKTGLLKIAQANQEEVSKMSIMDMTVAGLIEFVHTNELEGYTDVDPAETTREDGTEPEWVANNNFQRFIKIAEYPDDVEKLTLAHSNGTREHEQPFTHSEIIPYGQFGIAASCIPAAAHNHGPRITYQSSMSKQALSGYHAVHWNRFDTSFKRQIAPTRTFFETGMYQPIGLNAMPSTDTPIVAFYAMGVNNEDSIVVKKEFLDQHFTISKYITYKFEIGKRERIGLTPDQEEDKYDANRALWKSTDAELPNKEMIGLPKQGYYVRKGDNILGRIRAEQDKTGVTGDVFISAKTGVGKEGYIDRVDIMKNIDKTTIVRVKVVQYRRLISGDKMASRFSQKGTFGIVLPANKLPRIASGPNKGVVPDFFVNPHSIPSRMTQGWMIEMLCTKAVIYTGERIDASPFVGIPVKKFQDTLSNLGFDRLGDEDMMHPDGTKFDTKIFVGACAYQCLKHHVIDKLQKRDVGNKLHPLTHQPVGGRFNEGGLKFGEMEHDAVVSHGTSAITSDRLMESSDKYRAVICRNCGVMAVSDFTPARTRCQYCAKNDFVLVEIPYILQLINRMFIGIGMIIHFRFE